MPNGQVRIDGLKLTTKALKALDSEAPKEVKALNRSAAETVAEIARPLAPYLSGKLSGSIRAGANQRAGYVLVGGKLVPYAAPIHWGWPAHDIAPTPFLVEAAGRAEPAVEEEFSRGFGALIERVGL